ncbi:MAG: hypothetical protein FWF15_08830 [Oscillospiraceae bacterium]|nr:hypothetical protein [Oscillospiraceae bacterium]
MIVVIFMGCIAACAADPSNSGDTVTKQDSDNIGEVEDVDVRKAVPDDLPQKNYNGKVFTVIARDRSDFVADIGIGFEESGDVVRDAVYYRNMTIEERFNIKLEVDHVADPNTKLKSTVLANEYVYDLILGHVIATGGSVLDGNFVDWFNALPYVNLDKPWYIGNARDTLSVKNHSYLMAGEYCLSILRFTYCMYFNKSLAEIYQVEDLYKTVNDGKWTIDRLNGIVKDVYTDLNGDGVRDTDDLYGFSTDYYSGAVAYMYGFDNPVMQQNSEGIPEMKVNFEKTVAIIEKLNDFFWNNIGSYPETWGVTGGIWKGGRVMFINGLFGGSSSYRDYEYDYGIIPYPKWSEQQPAYYSMSDGAHDVMGVPVTISDPEFTSIIIEALNAETYKQVVPALYDVAFKIKYARDDMANEILDMILAGRYFDFGYVYHGGQGVAFLIQSLLSTKKTDYMSLYTSVEKQALTHYTKVIEGYLALDE